MEHHFNVQLAQKYGIEEAIIIHTLYFWVRKNVANQRHFYDGRYWTYNSIDAFIELFPYLNESKIYRIFKSLEQQGVICKGNFNDDKMKRTNWYAFTDKAIKELGELGYATACFGPCLQNEGMQVAKMQNASCKNEECNTDSNIITDKVIIDNNKEKEKKLSTKKEKDGLFEDCWIAYRRKGSKKQAYEQWKKIKDDDKVTIIRHIKAYVMTRELHYQKDFERYLRDGIYNEIVIKGNQVVFDPMATNNNEYRPQCDVSLMWNEQEKMYIYIGFWDGRFIPDGYSDDERPDGAEVMLNNGRGIVHWNASIKKWEKRD